MQSLIAQISGSLNEFPNFLLFLGVGTALVVASTIIYVRLTPYTEFSMVHDGNVAAALSLGGAMLGFALPVVTMIAHTQAILVMVVWSVIGLAAQGIGYLLVTVLYRDLKMQMDKENAAVGATLATVHVIMGLLVSAALTS